MACATTASDTGQSVSGADSPSRDCIFRSSIRGYSVLDESNLIIEATGRRNYHMKLMRRAYGLDSSRGIDFDSATGSVCSGFDKVLFRGNLEGRDSVPIASIRELTPEDHEDLLIQFGKKAPEIEQGPAPQEVEGAEVEELDPAADSNGN